MIPKDWMELALKLAREGDTTSDMRRKMLHEQVRGCLESTSRETLQKVEEDRRRGLLRHK